MAETIGTLVDKISIFELKRFHMEDQMRRMDVSREHREECGRKLGVLTEQRDDLVKELNGLFNGIKSGRKKIKLYRQFKMYNDPRYK
ncbi:MAG: DUF4254 domain-containing protein [bacterium]